MDFDPNMELGYAEDALALETSVDIVDPETGERDGFICDNLTTVMYFLVSHGLKPVREGLRELAVLDLPNDDREIQLGDIKTTLREILESFRNKNNLPVQLYIEVEGDPKLAQEF